MFTIVASSTTISCASPTTRESTSAESRTLLMEVASGMRLTTSSSFSVVTAFRMEAAVHRDLEVGCAQVVAIKVTGCQCSDGQ